jgi:cyclophilin family peptidyl-prolyl cis-trans isomerase
MAEHKRATEVTIAPLEERSAFQTFFEKYWVGMAVVLLAGASVVLAVQYRSISSDRELAASWDELRATLDLGALTGRLTSEHSDQAASAAEDLVGTPAGPWARAIEVGALIRKGDYDAADTALALLRQEAPDHPVNTEKVPHGEEGLMFTVCEILETQIAQWREFSASRTQLFSNPAPPADAPRVRLATDAGDIVVALYSDRAPQHVDNFVKLAGDGTYEGTRFHRNVPSLLVAGGDPYSRDADTPEERAKWGDGNPGWTIPKEETGLSHFEGVLAAWKETGEDESNGSQFYITLSPYHLWDKTYVVFGTVVEGMEVVRAINARENEENSDRPANPVVLERTEVL